jgi:hypothetical protein
MGACLSVDTNFCYKLAVAAERLRECAIRTAARPTRDLGGHRLSTKVTESFTPNGGFGLGLRLSEKVT